MSKKAFIFVLPLLLVLCGCSARDIKADSFYIALQGINIDKLSQLNYDLIIIDYSYDGSETGELKSGEVDRLKESGKKVFSYLSVGEAEDYRFYWKDSFKENPPSWLLSENPNWPGNYTVAFWDDGWQKIVFEYIDRIVKAGFDGIFIDRVDVYKEFADEDKGKDYQKLMIEFLKEIIKNLNDKNRTSFKIILNNGEELPLKDYVLFRNICGLVAESLYTDGSGNIRSEEEIKVREKPLIRLKRAGKCVMVIEYSVSDDKQLILKERANKKKFLIQFLNPSLSL
jgi:cysteinyl-tRNA synthetase